MSSLPPQPARPPAPIWREIGRSWQEEAPAWTTWVAPLDDDGGDLYRLLIVADGAITVAVDLHPRHRSRPHALHRSRCDVPHDPVEAAERVCALLRVSDEAVARTVDAGRSGTGMAEGHGRPSCRVAGTSREEGRNAVSNPRHEFEHHLRERAYFLWEREGRPEGHAHEFWERACREEARAA
jgi:hypothetical protein